VAAGYQPEIAYFECLHELKLIVDLMYRGVWRTCGIQFPTRQSTAITTAGPRIVTDETRAEMKKLLTEIQNGTFAKNWDRRDKTAGRSSRRCEERSGLKVEEVGATLRAAMPFLDPVVVKDGVPQPAAAETVNA